MNKKGKELLEQATHEPINHFSAVKKLIQNNKINLGEAINNNKKQITLDYLNIISQLPQIVLQCINKNIRNYNKKKTFDINKTYSKIIDELQSHEYQGGKNNELQKIRIYDLLQGNSKGIEDHGIFYAIYAYLIHVQNNIDLLNINENRKNNPGEILGKLRPKYTDILKKYSSESIDIELIDGIISFYIKDKQLLNELNELDKIKNRGGLSSSQGEYMWILYSKDSMDLLFQSLGINMGTAKDHELQHIYNKSYQTDERKLGRIATYIYNQAKDEIIAQFQNRTNPEKIYTLLATAKPYQYLSNYLNHEGLEDSIATNYESSSYRLERMKETKAPETSVLMWEKIVKGKEKDIDILKNSNIRDNFHEEYLENIKKYITNGLNFIEKSDGIIKDPYVILAGSQMDEREELNNLFEE